MIAWAHAQDRSENGLHIMEPRRHLREVADLLEVAFQDAVDMYGRAALREMRLFGFLARWLGNWVLGPGIYGHTVISFVWLEQGHVIGHAMVHQVPSQGRRWRIVNVAVAPAYRNRGIGRALMKAALEYIEARGGTWAILQVRDTNAPALHLYRSLGFSEIGGEIHWEFGGDAWQRVQAPERPLLRRISVGAYHEIEALHRHAFGEASSWWWEERTSPLPPEGFFHWLRRLVGQITYRRQGLWYDGHLRVQVDIRVDRSRGYGEFSLLVDRLYWGRWEHALLQEVLTQTRARGAHTVYTLTPTDYPEIIAALTDTGFRQRVRLLNMRKPIP